MISKIKSTIFNANILTSIKNMWCFSIGMALGNLIRGTASIGFALYGLVSLWIILFMAYFNSRNEILSKKREFTQAEND